MGTGLLSPIHSSKFTFQIGISALVNNPSVFIAQLSRVRFVIGVDFPGRFILIRHYSNGTIRIVHINGTADSINVSITRILPKAVLARVITLIIILCNPMVP